MTIFYYNNTNEKHITQVERLNGYHKNNVFRCHNNTYLPTSGVRITGMTTSQHTS